MVDLTRQEIDDLVVDWEPEPLVSASVAKEAPENPDAITRYGRRTDRFIVAARLAR